MVWKILNLPSAPPLPLKLANDIIASCCVQQLPRNSLCHALISLQQNCHEVQNQGVTEFCKGLCVFWLTPEGQIASLNCSKWSNKGCYTSLYSISCLDTKGSGIWTGCPSKQRLLLLLSGNVINSACPQSNASRRQELQFKSEVVCDFEKSRVRMFTFSYCGSADTR